jgi:hypothetical protein
MQEEYNLTLEKAMEYAQKNNLPGRWLAERFLQEADRIAIRGKIKVDEERFKQLKAF